MVQVAADEMKDRYMLLLQLGPDTALDRTVGEMGPLQSWITLKTWSLNGSKTQ